MKTYVLDTNVILHDPKAPFKFVGNQVIIPLTVVEEIDNFKQQQNTLGQNARIFSRDINKLLRDGDLSEGVEIEDLDITLKIEKNHTSHFLPKDFDAEKVDNRIISVTKYFEETGTNPVILVSKDTNMRIKAHSVGLNVEDYMNDVVELDELYKGYVQKDVSDDFIDKFYKDGEVEMDGTPNQFFEFACGNHSAIGKYKKGVVQPFRTRVKAWNLTPKNREQTYALNLLMDDSVQLVSLVGKAGSGKTILSLAAGLEKAINQDIYERLIVFRPIVPMGNDIGYLPGDEEEKLSAWMRPIKDNLEQLTRKRTDSGIENKLTMEALTYIRGRSVKNSFIIIDEAQNLSAHEVKTILTRAGENTKIILTGDPHQIDHPYLDSNTNGLTYVVEKMKDSKLSGSVLLTKGERSPLAEEAADKL